MPLVGFERTIPAFEWAKTVHALNRAATVIGRYMELPCRLWSDVQFMQISRFAKSENILIMESQTI
jgi:hypothetical protein